MEDIKLSKKDADMLRDPDRWPIWPLLPVKRFGSRQQALGVVASLFEDGKLRLWLYVDQNLFSFDSTASREEVTDIDAFLAEGWRVD